jgi:hypothetical protein
MRRVSSIVLVLVALACAPAAYADTSVIPDTPDLPWTHPTHESPLEVLASRIASEITQRPVRVYCDSQTDWDAGPVPSAWGYVVPPRFWSPALTTWTVSSTQARLAPVACEHLWRFAKASSKPTKCPASRTVTTTRKVTVRYRATVPVKVTRRVKVNGVWVKKRVTVKKIVWKTRLETRTETTTTEVDPVPCYKPSIGPDVVVRSGDPAYRSYVYAIQTLAHEAFHLADITAGKPAIIASAVLESRAECFGLQRIARVASALGATEDDAVSMALFYVETFYAGRQSSSPDYWSAECRPGGALDLEPGTPSWPTG